MNYSKSCSISIRVKPVFILFLLLSGGFRLFAQTSGPDITVLSEEYLNQTDAKGHKQGYWQYRPENENVVLEVNFKNDTMQGDCKVFDEAGKLIETRRYQKGIVNGYFKKYWPDGKIQEEGCYDDNILIGIHKTYYPNGVLKIFSVYVAGDLDGPYIEYDKMGKLRINSTFQDGKKSGSEKIYAKDGKSVVVENYFENGNRVLTAVRDKKGRLLEVIPRDQNPALSTNYKQALTW